MKLHKRFVFFFAVDIANWQVNVANLKTLTTQ